MDVTCVGGPHDGRVMEVPENGVRLEFLDGSGYYIAERGKAFFKIGHLDESDEQARRRLGLE